MSSSNIPVASEVMEVVAAEPMELESVVASLKSLDTADLFKVMKQALSEEEKRAKGTATRGKAVAAKKTGSMPKGVVPPQLRKPRMWVEFTLKHALLSPSHASPPPPTPVSSL